MNHESLVEKYLGITNYHTEKIPLPARAVISVIHENVSYGIIQIEVSRKKLE